MPRLICLALMMIFAASAVANDLAPALQKFDEGNQRFRNGDYRGAVDAYQRVIEMGFVSGALYYNLGNAYFRMDEIGEAIRHYERAHRFIPESCELVHNLAIARARTLDEFSRVPEPFWHPFWQSVVRHVGPTGLFLAGVIFYVLAAGAMAARIRRGPSDWRRRVLTASAALAVLFVVLGFTASVEAESQRDGVVLWDEVTLVDKPDGSESNETIHEGLVVGIVSERGSWLEIRLPNGATGWVRAESVGEI